MTWSWFYTIPSFYVYWSKAMRVMMCSYLKSFSTLKTLSSLFYSLSSFCLFFSMLTQRSYCLSILGRQLYITTLSWLKAHCITLSAFSTCCIIKAYTNVISIWLLVIIDFISLLAPSVSPTTNPGQLDILDINVSSVQWQGKASVNTYTIEHVFTSHGPATKRI